MKIIILTTFDDDDYVYNALQYGAVGYILKDIEQEELVSAVKSVYGGSVLFSSAVASRIINKASTAGRDDTQKNTAEINYLISQFPLLSRREAEVLHLIIQNLDNQEIADTLFIAGQTVKNYISRIYSKLGVEDRLHAIQLVKRRREQR
jgi:DNA-binding NarL/FixJ family response regulator